MIGILKTCYKKASSRDDFYANLQESGLSTYIRGGKISGIIYNNKKFRINRLGFTEERLTDLDKFHDKRNEIESMRKQRSKIIKRNL